MSEKLLQLRVAALEAFVASSGEQTRSRVVRLVGVAAGYCFLELVPFVFWKTEVGKGRRAGFRLGGMRLELD